MTKHEYTTDGDLDTNTDNSDHKKQKTKQRVPGFILGADERQVFWQWGLGYRTCSEHCTQVPLSKILYPRMGSGDELASHPELYPICSWDRHQQLPCDPERDKEVKKMKRDECQ